MTTPWGLIDIERRRTERWILGLSNSHTARRSYHWELDRMDIRLESGGDPTVASCRNSRLECEQLTSCPCRLGDRASTSQWTLRSHGLSILGSHQFQVRASQRPAEVLRILLPNNHQPWVSQVEPHSPFSDGLRVESTPPHFYEPRNPSWIWISTASV